MACRITIERSIRNRVKEVLRPSLRGDEFRVFGRDKALEIVREANATLGDKLVGAMDSTNDGGYKIHVMDSAVMRKVQREYEDQLDMEETLIALQEEAKIKDTVMQELREEENRRVYGDSINAYQESLERLEMLSGGKDTFSYEILAPLIKDIFDGKIITTENLPNWNLQIIQDLIDALPLDLKTEIKTENGNPTVIFHGSPNPFIHHRDDKLGRYTGSPSAFMGHFGASDPATALSTSSSQNNFPSWT